MNSCAKLFILIAIAGVCVILYLATLEEHVTTDLNCGKRPERPSTMMPFDYDDYGGGRFVGGTPIDPSIWPWQVSIMHRPTAADPFQHHCGGAIISQDWILTAAVCVQAPQHRLSSNLIVKAGTTDTNHNDANTQELQIERIVPHKLFNPITLRYNIALLKLKPPLVFNTFVDEICIPDNSNVEEHQYGICHITGYAGPNANTSILQEAEVKKIGTPRCNMPTWWNYKVARDMFCMSHPSGMGGPDGCEVNRGRYNLLHSDMICVPNGTPFDQSSGVPFGTQTCPTFCLISDILDNMLMNLGGPVSCFMPANNRYYIYGVRVYAKDCGVPRRPNIYLKSLYTLASTPVDPHSRPPLQWTPIASLHPSGPP
ncbi:chymotrypsinogen B [Oncorhynchus mykiss]|uniref:chymotrypsinogen B n=1 Tax=Oncorhynchus mykiss TaxID=8022 RepID=UPI0018776134|nr:chymotrypsinogen B [Oncorhynchus mykiss]